jgi:shikimate dehydrogenase
MKRAAVLGSPISHSLSPLLHNTAYQMLGLEAEYSAIEMVPEAISSFLDSLDSSWIGLSLTMPLKESVLDLDIDIDEIVSRTRSANTILLDGGGQPRATSTDYLAFKRLIKVEPQMRVAILGAGGTARSALGALAGSLLEVDVYLRDLAKGSHLASCAPQTTLTLHQLSELCAQDLATYDWLISTLPSGVTNALAEEIASSKMTFPNLDFLEVLYNPWPTELLIALKSAGASTLDGLDLLVEQALDQIHLMTGESFDFDTMRRVLIAKGLSVLNK